MVEESLKQFAGLTFNELQDPRHSGPPITRCDGNDVTTDDVIPHLATSAVSPVRRDIPIIKHLTR